MKAIIVGLSFLICSSAYPATYYVDNNVANDNGEGSWSSPKKYIKSGVGLLSSGDTLIIKDGTYTGIDNMLSSPGGWEYMGIPSGTIGGYTIVRAEHDGGVIIDGQDTFATLCITNSYIQIEGIKLKSSGHLGYGSNFGLIGCDHVKVLRCGSEESYHSHFALTNCTYCLIEDCFAWGRTDYAYVTWGSGDCAYNIFRRCVSRRDAHWNEAGGNHWASFVTYQKDQTYFQNCISIDGEFNESGTGGGNPYKYSFFTANGGSNFNILSCISLNDQGGLVELESNASPVNIINSVLIASTNLYNAENTGILTYGNSVTIENCTIMNNLGVGDWQGIAIGEVGQNILSAKNNILCGNRYGFANVDGEHSYNALYNNSVNNYHYTNTGTGEIVNTNPLTNGLLYPTRIEAASTLKSAGSSGGQIGAEIVYKLGVSGTLYGETGWNTLTGDLLWPFPNEDTIRTQMRAYNLHSVDGTRGFCADGETLTHYIMNYLGNGDPYADGGETAYATSVQGGVNANATFR